MVLATVHAGLASPAGGLGVYFVALSTAAAVTATASSFSILHLVKAFIEGLDGGKDGILVAGCESVRHICGRLFAGGLVGRGFSVDGAGVHRRLDSGGEVCHLCIHLAIDVLVDGLYVGGTVVSCDYDAALDKLVQAMTLDVAVTEERDEIIESVVGCARADPQSIFPSQFWKTAPS